MNVKLESDGGFTGRGIGHVLVENGGVTASDGFRVAHGPLLPDEERELRDVMKDLVWEDAAGEPHPDQITYRLSSDGRTMSWHGESVEIGRVLWKIRDRVLHARRA